jgi:uncharacterized YigZ family protein
MDERYSSVYSEVSIQRKVEGSRFITDVFPVSSEFEAKEKLKVVRKKYFDASHHCFAFVIGREKQSRFSDDGEPSGTAGVKIQSAIQSKHLSDILLIVTRYFGGTKLGVGGLGRAYFESALEGLNAAQIISKQMMQIVEVKFPFSDSNSVMNLIHMKKLKVESTQYTSEQTRLDILVNPSNVDKIQVALTDATRGNAEFVLKEQKIIIIQ